MSEFILMARFEDANRETSEWSQQGLLISLFASLQAFFINIIYYKKELIGTEYNVWFLKTSILSM